MSGSDTPVGTSAVGLLSIGVGPVGVPTTAGVTLTAGDVARLALLNSGAASLSQTIYAEDVYAALDHLNMMLAQWQRRRWLVWALADTSIVSTGAASYTIGPGANFHTARPDRIESAFARMLVTSSTQTDASQQPLLLDYPLQIIGSREDYNQIVLKGLSTFPAAVFLDSAWPFGVLHFWPIPQATQWELHVATKTALSPTLTLTTPLMVPLEYTQAIVYSLACMLRPVYGLPPEPSLMALSKAALATIRTANSQIPELSLAGVVGTGRRGSGIAAGSSQGFMGGGAW